VSEPLLELRSVTTELLIAETYRPVIEDVSFGLDRGEVVGLVGESGSGKSVTAFSIIRLVQNPGRIVSGRILFQGKDLLALSEEEMRQVRGAGIGFVFQEPMAALNPVMKVGAHIAEALLVHGLATRADARGRAIELLRAVKIVDPERRVDDYPHQLSGGMRQRVELARALGGDTPLLLMDEPFSSLDYLTRLKMRLELAWILRAQPRTVLLVTHDIEEAAQLADRVLVLSERPARIRDEVVLKVPRPRDPTDPEVVSAVRRILGVLGLKPDESARVGVKQN